MLDNISKNDKKTTKINIKINEIEGKETTIINVKLQGKKELSFRNINYSDYIDIQNKAGIITILDTFEEYEYINILITQEIKRVLILNKIYFLVLTLVKYGNTIYV